MSRHFSKNKALIVVVLSVAMAALLPPVTARGISANSHNKAMQEKLQIARMMLENNVKAENKLFEEMQAVARYLEKYVHRTKRLPQEESEIEAFRQAASTLVPEDPYDSGKPQVKQNIFGAYETEAPEAKSRIDFRLDYDLSDESVSAMTEQLPDSWKAEPGQICLVTNGLRWAVIWGAGSNHRPIRSHETGKPLVITLKVK